MKRYCRSGGLCRLISIPTVLGAIRIALLPLMIGLYCASGHRGISALPLLASVLAGFAAEVLIRRYDMATGAGVALSVVAGGVTCAGMLLCLASRFRRLLIPAGLLLLRGARDLIRRALYRETISRSGDCARICLYLLLFAHLLWDDIPAALSVALTAVACAFILWDLSEGMIRKKGAFARRA